MLLDPILLHAPCAMFWKDLNGCYLGCNKLFLAMSGLSDYTDLIGQNDFNLPWKQCAAQYTADDKYVMSTGQMITRVEDIPVLNRVIISETTKSPLIENGKIIGVIGMCLDITDRREAERLKLENETHKKVLDEQEKFSKLVSQVAHDIASPTAALSMLAEADIDGLPEEIRLLLKNIATRINDIARNLLTHYEAEVSIISTIREKQEPILLSSHLLQILAEKKLQYASLPIQFEYFANQQSSFAFIHMQSQAFKRMISNIINNAVEALDKEAGQVIVRIELEQAAAKIIIEDNGKGMSAAIIDKILNNIKITADKAGGHGIGMSQVRETLTNNHGKMQITSEVDKGTEVTLIFPCITTPIWIANHIHISLEDTVLILDDDPAIHGAWDKRFNTDAPDITVKHFTHGIDVINYVRQFPLEQKNKFLLLTDYELLKQEYTGLQVVEQTGLKRSILVTSHDEREEVRRSALRIGTQILPKPLASKIPIIINKVLTKKKRFLSKT